MLINSLIERLKDPAQKRLAFHELVSTYQRRLYWHIRKIVLDHDDTDDILQTVFMKVWSSIDNFREESSLYTWLFRIATNEALTFLAQKKKRKGFFIHSDEEYLLDKFSADQYFDGDELHRNLMLAVLKLPEKQRIVFNMKYFDEMKYEQISEILGTSVGALKASYHHAVKKIEESIKIVVDNEIN
jgi:RNA polymerase sigma-70 factor (ECF subfamily)